MKIFSTDYPLIAELDPATAVGMDRVYFRSDNALINSGKTIYRAPWMKELRFMPHLVVRVGRVGKGIDTTFAPRYYSEATLGFSLYDHEYMKSQQMEKLNPVLAYSFDGALMIGSMRALHDIDTRHSMVRVIEQGTVSRVISDPLSMPSSDDISGYISMLSNYFLLKMGDLITIPLWKKYVPLASGQHIHLSCDSEEILFMGIK